MKGRGAAWSADLLLDALDEEPRRSILSPASSLLSALEQTYSIGLSCYLGAERLRFRTRTRVPVPVISVGNLSVGGTGKTPATIMIASSLSRIGFKVAVLSRGHGGTMSSSGGVVSNNDGNILVSTAESGDEPMVLARSLIGVPVLVGKDRRLTAREAIARFRPDLLLLDDGFQYWQLWRDSDIVLLDAARPFDNGHCLPRGRLREPKANLDRAQIVIVTRSKSLSAAHRSVLSRQIAALAPRSSIFFADHAAAPYYAANPTAEQYDVPGACLAVCAVAQPNSFMATLEANGIVPVGRAVFPDHYDYARRHRSSIIGKMKECGASSVITTHKDAVKLVPLLPNVPIFVQPVQFVVEDCSRLMDNILELLSFPRSLAQRCAKEC